jgi:hypothetical protein
MNMRIFRAGAVACLLAASCAFAPTAAAAAAAADTGPKVSGPVGKLLGSAQKLMEAKQYPDALALVKQAEALPDTTDSDKFVINQFLGNIAIATQDYASADAAYEAMADSPLLPDNLKASTLQNATLLANQYKHYDKAVKYGEAYLAITPSNPNVNVLGTLAVAYYSLNDCGHARPMAQKALDATPAGQAPNRAALDVVLYCANNDHKIDDVMAVMEQLVANYDDRGAWSDLVDFSVAVKGISNTEALHIYRLRLASKATGTRADSFSSPAQIASTLQLPVEAQAFLDAGSASGALPGGGPTYATVKQHAIQDRSVEKSLAALAHKTPTGELDLKLAETYIGYGQYADAEAEARAAIQKGGAKTDLNEANMVLGEALAMQGKNADAAAAFNALKNPTPGWTKAQHLWLIFVNRKYATAAN